MYSTLATCIFVFLHIVHSSLKLDGCTVEMTKDTFKEKYIYMIQYKLSASSLRLQKHQHIYAAVCIQE